MTLPQYDEGESVIVELLRNGYKWEGVVRDDFPVATNQDALLLEMESHPVDNQKREGYVDFSTDPPELFSGVTNERLPVAAIWRREQP